MGKSAINDNDSFLKETSMTMNMGRRKLCSDIEAESGAERLVRLLNAPECRKFFIKVMYHLPYDERERILESSHRKYVKSPKKYFTYCAKQAMSKIGY